MLIYLQTMVVCQNIHTFHHTHGTVIWCNMWLKPLLCRASLSSSTLEQGTEGSTKLPSGKIPRVHKGSELTETIPYHPWDCFIYLHGWLILMVNVGRYNIHGWYGYDNPGTPWKIDMVHLQISHLERNIIFQTSMIMLKPLIFRDVIKTITVQQARITLGHLTYWHVTWKQDFLK